jgi:hypothetical protein
MKVYKLFLAAVGATVLLGALISSASARNLSISNQSIRASFSSVSFNGPFGTTRCHVTLEGSLHARTFAKVSGSLIGYITSAILGPCQSFSFTILRETLPWHVRYSGFNGPLPSITSLITHVVGFAYRIREPGGVTCLARSEANEPAVITYHRNTTTQRLEEAGISGRIRTGPECFGAALTLASDSARVSVLGASHTSIFVSLI